MVASYFAQGAFKETMQALFVLAFALVAARGIAQIAAAGAARRCASSRRRCWQWAAVYVYSFPGLIWLAGDSWPFGMRSSCSGARQRSVGRRSARRSGRSRWRSSLSSSSVRRRSAG